MKKQKVDAEFHAWAEQGAKQQLERIYKRFPRLRPAASARPTAAAGSAPPEAPPQAKRRTMSKAARKRISDAQKARWAKKRRD
jgi:hypothetical protein